MNSKKWIDSNGAIYDSYKSDYMIFVNRNCDFNFLKNTELDHIILIKDENRIKSFVKFCERENKMIIYIKKSFQKDVLNEITTKNYILIQIGLTNADVYSKLSELIIADVAQR